jgi:hypothetical protein
VRRAALVAVLAATAAVVPAAPAAAACPHEGASHLHSRLTQADGALVGWLSRRRGRTLTFRVQVRVKGVRSDRVRVHVPRGCRTGIRLGQRSGLLLDRRDGRWDASGVADPVALLKAAGIGP